MTRLATCLLVLLLAGCAALGNTDTPTYRSGNLEPRPEAAEPNALLGIRHMQRGDNNLAMTHLQRALVHDPNLPVAHNAIAVLYERLGQYAEAEAHFRKVLRIAPGDSDAHNNFGRFLCGRGRYAEADEHFHKALANPLYRTPQNSYTNAGLCALQAGDTARAEAYFKDALGKVPTFPPALLQIAKLRWAADDVHAARDYLVRLQGVTRPSPEVLWLRIQVEQKLGDYNASSSYALLLRNQFPDSPEAQQLMATEQR